MDDDEGKSVSHVSRREQGSMSREDNDGSEFTASSSLSSEQARDVTPVLWPTGEARQSKVSRVRPAAQLRPLVKQHLYDVTDNTEALHPWPQLPVYVAVRVGWCRGVQDEWVSRCLPYPTAPDSLFHSEQHNTARRARGGGPPRLSVLQRQHKKCCSSTSIFSLPKNAVLFLVF